MKNNKAELRLTKHGRLRGYLRSMTIGGRTVATLDSGKWVVHNMPLFREGIRQMRSGEASHEWRIDAMPRPFF